MARCGKKGRRPLPNGNGGAPSRNALPPTTVCHEHDLAHRPRRQAENNLSSRTRLEGGARHLSRRGRRIGRSGHGPDARGAHPRGVVAPLEEVCFMPEARSAICVQRFDDSLNSAIRTTYRISLRSSSLLMPRYPSTRVVYFDVGATGAQTPVGGAANAQTRARRESAEAGCESRLDARHKERTARLPKRRIKCSRCG